jgi:hypothetical protein
VIARKTGKMKRITEYLIIPSVICGNAFANVSRIYKDHFLVESLNR